MVVIALLARRRRQETRLQHGSEADHEPLTKDDVMPSVPPTISRKKMAQKHTDSNSVKAKPACLGMMLLSSGNDAPLRPASDSTRAAVVSDFEAELQQAHGRVRVQGLCSEPQHNGEEGVVVGPTADGTRWNVRCLNGVRLSLKPQNIEPLMPEDGVHGAFGAVDCTI